MSMLPSAPFGRLLTAMVTPMVPGGGLDLDGAARLATHLVEAGCAGLVVSGTTGESPTVTDAEQDLLLRAVLDAVGDRARVVAGVGTFDTAHTVELARAAEKAGAHGLLAVTPYYSRPPQEGLLAHFRTLADATELPVLLYDIPVRTGVALATDTLVRLAEHPRIVGVKDAKGDLAATAKVLARSDLAVYSGDDALTLPLLSVGACGTVGVVTHVVAPQVGELIEAVDRGELARAREINAALLGVYDALFRTQAAILVKAALALSGLPGGPVRPPLVDATPAQVEQLRADLAAAGVVAA
ncbi:MAG: 4-hydroxy-tetrahydrodipicolinate synthase [Mycobacteriales bacterium]